MEKIWRINGAHASWTLTLHIGPPDDDTVDPMSVWPKRVNRIARYFQDVVNCQENAMEIERLLNMPGVVQSFLHASERNCPYK
jgi:hypothetical protein